MEETDDLRALKPVMFTGAQAKSSAGGDYVFSLKHDTNILCIQSKTQYKYVVFTDYSGWKLKMPEYVGFILNI